MTAAAALILSDAHIHPHRIGSRDGGEDRLADGLSVIRQSFQLARDLDCAWVYLGDIKLVHGIWPQAALSGLLELMREYDDVTRYMIPGNGGHDGIGTKESGASGYDPFRAYAHVIDTPGASHEPLLGTVAWWPWCPPALAVERLPPFLDEARTVGARTLFMHGMFTGSRVGPTETKLHTGYALGDFMLVGPRSRRAFDLVFAGDVHVRQVLGDVARKRAAAIYVPGSPYAQNWGERELDKGVLLLGTDGTHSKVWHATLSSPRFRVIDVRGKWERVSYAGDFVRLLVATPPTPEFLAEFRTCSACRVLEYEVVRPERSAPTTKRSNAATTMSRTALLDEYARVTPLDGVATMTAPIRKALVAAGVHLLKGKGDGE